LNQDSKTHAQLRETVWINCSKGEFILGSRCENTINSRGITGMHGAAFLDELPLWLQARPTKPAGSFWRGRWRGDRVVRTDKSDPRLKTPTVRHPVLGIEVVVRDPNVPPLKDVSDEVAASWCSDFGTPWQRPDFGDETEVAA
jgi:hypothetical protein